MQTDNTPEEISALEDSIGEKCILLMEPCIRTPEDFARDFCDEAAQILKDACTADATPDQYSRLMRLETSIEETEALIQKEVTTDQEEAEAWQWTLDEAVDLLGEAGYWVHQDLNSWAVYQGLTDAEENLLREV